MEIFFLHIVRSEIPLAYRRVSSQASQTLSHVQFKKAWTLRCFSSRKNPNLKKKKKHCHYHCTKEDWWIIGLTISPLTSLIKIEHSIKCNDFKPLYASTFSIALFYFFRYDRNECANLCTLAHTPMPVTSCAISWRLYFSFPPIKQLMKYERASFSFFFFFIFQAGT